MTMCDVKGEAVIDKPTELLPDSALLYKGF